MRVRWTTSPHDSENYVASIISGFRTPASNAACDGVSGSLHLKGLAVDIIMDNIPRENQKIFLDEAISLGITGVGSYFSSSGGTDFFHLDIGTKRHWGPDTAHTSQYAWVIPIL